MHKVEYQLRLYVVSRFLLLLHSIAPTNIKGRALAQRLGVNPNTIWKYRRMMREDFQAPPWCLNK